MQFINVGVDHGTSNSCVAVMTQKGPEIVQADSQDPTSLVLPSAVHMSNKGVVLVGSAARQAMMLGQSSKGNGYTGYKPRLGSDDRFAFDAAGKVLTARELGKIVLDTLLEPCAKHMRRRPVAVVLTVPAKFNSAQYEGTRKAAEKAGIQHVIMLQEPIAAALAYGFNAGDQNARWIIFDLGGGTLDTSLVTVENGELSIPKAGHAGDPDLGGRLFDTALLGYVLGPKKDDTKKWTSYRKLDRNYSPLRAQYALEGFSENVQREAWGRLMLAVEAAKIQLSTEESAVVTLETPLCRDERGKTVEVEVTVTRAVYERLIESHVTRAVNCCLSLLRNNRMRPDEINCVIMVGGPSKTPYVQAELKRRLGIELEASVDPMTAVAVGAAVHASSQALPEELELPPPTPTDVSVKLVYKGSSQSVVCDLNGQIMSNEVEDYSGFTVVIERTDGLWDSGRLTPDSDGFFEGEVMLIKGENGTPVLSQFRTVVRDASGNTVVELEEPKVWYPSRNERGDFNKLASSMMIQTEGNHTELLLEMGEGLPAEGEESFRLPRALRAGNKKDKLVVEVLEAVTDLLGLEDFLHADCNQGIGQLEVTGDQLDADLPANSELDISVHVGEDRKATVTVFVPATEQEFKATFLSGEFHPELKELRTRLASLKRSIEESRKLLQSEPNETVEEALEKIADEKCIENIEDNMALAEGGNHEAARLAYKGILRLTGTVYRMRSAQQKQRINNRLSEIESTVGSADRGMFDAVRDACASANPDELDAVEEQLGDVVAQVICQELDQLVTYLNAIAWAVRENKNDYLTGIVEHLPLVTQGHELINELLARGGEADNRDMAVIRDMSRRNMITREDQEKTANLLQRIRAIPRIESLVVDYQQSLATDGHGTTDGNIMRPGGKK